MFVSFLGLLGPPLSAFYKRNEDSQTDSQSNHSNEIPTLSTSTNGPTWPGGLVILNIYPETI